MSRHLAILLFVAFGLVPIQSVRADEPTLHLYVFGAAHCDYCQKAADFLRRLKLADGRFTLKEYDIERSSEEAELFVKVLQDIGLREPVVPMVIIGPHVLLGFDDDETSGREIRRYVDVCQTEACPDFVADLTVSGRVADQRHSWRVQYRWASAALRR